MGIPGLDLTSLRSSYTEGRCTPSDIARSVHAAVEQDLNLFTYVVPLQSLLSTCAALEKQPVGQRGRFWGVPFAVKDNVDVAGVPTTATCPAFTYNPAATAPAVQALIQEGAVFVGKTNMDQFASGLVGTRSPFGAAVNPFDHRFITGGSSSGSGGAVGHGMVTFAIGTDTAGSGRIPAGFNGCVGIKPTVGSISTVGVVRACASLDCLSVFCHSAADGAEVAAAMRTGSPGRAGDVWRRDPPASVPLPGAAFKFAVPYGEFLDWTGPGGVVCEAKYQELFTGAIAELKALGGELVEIDFAPFAEAAAALYGGAFVAERFSGIRKFLEKGRQASNEQGPLEAQKAIASDARLLPVIRHIIALSGKFTATDLFDDMARMAGLKAAAAAQLAKVDLLLVPTALHHYTVAEIQEQEDCAAPTWGRNANLGRFTNFVNLLDMCGVAVPYGVVRYDAAKIAEDASEEVVKRKQHLTATGPSEVALPFGVTLLSKAWTDGWVADLAGKLHARSGLGCGPQGHGVTPLAPPDTVPAAKKARLEG